LCSPLHDRKELGLKRSGAQAVKHQELPPRLFLLQHASCFAEFVRGNLVKKTIMEITIHISSDEIVL